MAMCIGWAVMGIAADGCMADLCVTAGSGYGMRTVEEVADDRAGET